MGSVLDKLYDTDGNGLLDSSVSPKSLLKCVMVKCPDFLLGWLDVVDKELIIQYT